MLSLKGKGRGKACWAADYNTILNIGNGSVTVNISVKMKRFLCLAMTVLLGLPIFANPVLAAETQMSTESLFLNYPQYLTNERMNEGTAACESACYAVLNSYNNKGDSLVAALITALNDGLTIQ